MKNELPNYLSSNIHPWKLGFFLIFTVVTWASTFFGIRLGLEGYTPGGLALLRHLVSGVCMLFLFLTFLPKTRPSLKESVYIFMAGLCGFAIYNLALSYGLISVEIGMASFIISQIPVAITLLAAIYLKEHITPRMWLGITISVFGISMIAYSHYEARPQWDFGMVYLMIAVIVSGIYAVLYKSLAKKFHPIHLTAYAIWAGMFALFIYFPQMLAEIRTAPAYATWSAIYLGAVPSFMGYLSWGYVLRYMPASKASGILYAIPVLATAMAWLLFGELPQTVGLIGGFIALIGAFIINRRSKTI